MNEALCRMLGRRPAELLGQPVSGVTHPDDSVHPAGGVHEAEQNGSRALFFEKRYVRPTARWCAPRSSAR